MTKAFTLIELILVLALLTVITALAAPSLSRSFRKGDLENQALALLAATEYARSEAVSQGVPMTLWVDEESGYFGVRPPAGFEGVPEREKAWPLHQDIRFQDIPPAEDGLLTFQPDGTLELDSAEQFNLLHRDGESMAVVKKENAYRIEKE